MKRRCFLCLLILLFSCTGKVPFRVGKNYVIDTGSSSYFYLYNNQNRGIIRRNIEEFDFDSIYIIAKQKPIDDIMNQIDRDYPGLRLNEELKLIEKSRLYNYWIINKKKNYIYGPLTKARYKELKDSLHIHLELNDTYENIK